MIKRQFTNGGGMNLNGQTFISRSSSALLNESAGMFFPKVKANNVSITFHVNSDISGAAELNFCTFNGNSRSSWLVYAQYKQDTTVNITDGRIMNGFYVGGIDYAAITQVRITFNDVENVEE